MPSSPDLAVYLMHRISVILTVIFLAGCTTSPQREPCPPSQPCPACPACPTCPQPEPPKPEAKPLQPATWSDLAGWTDEDLQPAFEAFRGSCALIGKQARWQAVCEQAQALVPTPDADALRAWFQSQFQPWALTNADGSQSGLITGYYEPVIKGSRTRQGSYRHPLFSPPDDLIDVDLAQIYPELKHLRLRGRIEGRRLIPYFTRAEWTGEQESRAASALFWIDDPLDLFFMEIQGSGQIALDDGSRTRVSYADQNGHPFRSIGRWLVNQGELKVEEASLQGIKNWARAHPQRLRELLDANPSLVFFRELPLEGSGPPGALGLPLTPERSIAVDPRHVPLGAPIFMATTWPNSDKPLNRLMLAQDTGGAIRGVVRADFYWGSGAEAGRQAGRMRQKGSMWILLPIGDAPK